MDIIFSLLQITLLAAIAFLFFKKNSNQPQDLSLRSERDKLSEKSSFLYQENTELKAQNKQLQQTQLRLEKEISQLKAQQQSYTDTLNKQINHLAQANKSLIDEKERLTLLDLQRQKKTLSQRDKIWTQHEQNVITLLTEHTASSRFYFPSYSNTTLPQDFNSKLKPDFIIEFLDQYLIFDAKSSRSDNFANYIKDQVKKTTTKIQTQNNIYPLIFFVVPDQALTEISQTHFYEQGIDYFVISPSVLPTVLFSLKKITTYEFADHLDPQNRDEMVALIAELYQHINFNNASNLLLTEMGIKNLQKLNSLNENTQEEIHKKRQKMRLNNFKPSDLKNLMQSIQHQHRQIKKHISPQVDISNVDLLETSQSFIDEKPK